ncbi:NUDIX domain-containing protein [Nocardia sp. NPDC004654]|uniref:NUDIX hydrolase n=1 Tax=Nocardia sp. NPDC004654 TaxID=3154776 RepID=UPI0033B2EB06
MSATVTGRHKLVGDVHLVLVDDQGRYLFGRRINTGYEDGAWHLPSGHLESDESIVEALVREAAEEIGVVIAPENVRFAHVMHNSSSGGRAAFFFLVSTWAGIPSNQEPDKCDALAWFALTELPDRMIAYCRAALGSIADGEPFSVYGW